MTIDQQVTDRILPQLDVVFEDEDELPARVIERSKAIELIDDTHTGKFEKTMFAIDIMGMFHHDYTETKTWDEFFNKAAVYVIKQAKGIRADIIVICVDLLTKNEAREFVAQTRRDATKNAIPIKVPAEVISPNSINIFSTKDFPFKDAPNVDFNTAYRNSAEFKKYYLYPMMKHHFLRYLKSLLGKIILFGFDDRKAAPVPGIGDLPDMIKIPVEGDFQLMSWLLLCVEKQYQIIIDSFDGDILPALFLQLDRLIALGLASALHKNQFWWVRSVRTNVMHVCVLQAYKVMCGQLYSMKNMHWPGATIALVFFVRGNDYVNVRKETKIDNIDLLTFHRLLIDVHKTKGPVVYLTVDCVGRVVFEIDHKILAPLIIESRGKHGKPISFSDATVLCRQMAFCLNYFMIEPLTAFTEDCVSPKMTQNVSGLPYYSYSRTPSTNDFISSSLCASNHVPTYNSNAGIDKIGCLFNKSQVIVIDEEEQDKKQELASTKPASESGIHKRLKKELNNCSYQNIEIYYSRVFANHSAWLCDNSFVEEVYRIEEFKELSYFVML